MSRITCKKCGTELIDISSVCKDIIRKAKEERDKEILNVIGEMKERFGARPLANKGEEQDKFISYLDIKKFIHQSQRK